MVDSGSTIHGSGMVLGCLSESDSILFVLAFGFETLSGTHLLSSEMGLGGLTDTELDVRPVIR